MLDEPQTLELFVRLECVPVIWMLSIQKKGSPKLQDLVQELVDHFFKGESKAAKDFMVWRCSGQAPVEVEEISEALLDVLDEENRQAFTPDKSKAKYAGKVRSTPVNFTPEALKMLVPPAPKCRIALQQSIQTIWGTDDHKRFHSRRWEGTFTADRTRLQAASQVVNLLWDAHAKLPGNDDSGRPTTDAIHAALTTLAPGAVGKGTPPLKGAGKGAGKKVLDGAKYLGLPLMKCE